MSGWLVVKLIDYYSSLMDKLYGYRSKFNAVGVACRNKIQLMYLHDGAEVPWDKQYTLDEFLSCPYVKRLAYYRTDHIDSVELPYLHVDKQFYIDALMAKPLNRGLRLFNNLHGIDDDKSIQIDKKLTAEVYETDCCFDQQDIDFIKHYTQDYMDSLLAAFEEIIHSKDQWRLLQARNAKYFKKLGEALNRSQQIGSIDFNELIYYYNKLASDYYQSPIHNSVCNHKFLEVVSAVDSVDQQLLIKNVYQSDMISTSSLKEVLRYIDSLRSDDGKADSRYAYIENRIIDILASRSKEV